VTIVEAERKKREERKMTLKISGSCIAWFFALVFVICSYPANYYMMQNEWGWYNNDPNYEWQECGKTYYGPSPGNRMALLAVSPVSAPLNALHELCETTYKGD
jgi:hypothetical protein